MAVTDREQNAKRTGAGKQRGQVQLFSKFAKLNRIIPVLLDDAELPIEVRNVRSFNLIPTAGKSPEWLIDELIIFLYQMIAHNTRDEERLTKQ